MKKIILFSKTNHLFTAPAFKEVYIQENTLKSDLITTKFRKITLKELMYGLGLYIIIAFFLINYFIDLLSARAFFDAHQGLLCLIGAVVGYFIIHSPIAFFMLALSLLYIQFAKLSVALFLSSILIGYIFSILVIFVVNRENTYITAEKTIFVILDDMN